MKNYRNYIILFIFCLIIGVCIKPIMQSEIFKVEDVEYFGDIHYTKFDIADKLQDIKGKSIFYLDTNKIADTIRKDVRIKDVDITKVYPSKIKVKIDESPLLAIRTVGNKTFLVDDKLDNIITLPEKLKYDKVQKYPVLTYDDSTKVDLTTIFNNLLKSKLFKSVSEIRKINNVWTIILNNNINVYTDTNVDTQKYNYGYKIETTEPIKQYMDLRFNDIVIK